MSNALNMTISHFEKLQEVSGHPVDTQGLKYAREQLAQADLSIKNMGDSINQATANQEGFNGSLNKTDGVVKSILSKFTLLYLATKAFRMFKDGFNTFSEYSGAMGQLQGVTGATAKEMSLLKSQAMAIGSSSIKGVTEVTEGMASLSRGGLEVREVLRSIPDSVNFAIASNMDLNESGKVLINTMKGFNLTANDSTRIMDVIAYAGSTSSSEIDEMGRAFRETAAVADNFNVSLEETAVLLKQMSTVASGTRAGRMVRQGLMRLGSMRKPVQDALNSINVDAIDPLTNNLKGIPQLIGEIENSFNEMGLSATAQMQVLEDIFGARFAQGWMKVIENGAEAFNEMHNDILENAEGFSEQYAQIMMDTTQGTMEIFKNQMQGLWISFYEGLSEGVVQEAFNSILSALHTTLQVILTLATWVITATGYAIQFVTNNLEILLPVLITLYTAYRMLTHQTLLFGMASNWVVAGIIIVVALFYALVAVINRVTGSSIVATGVLVGGIYLVLGAILNLAMLGYNILGGFFEFVINTGLTMSYYFQLAWYKIKVALLKFVIAGANSISNFGNGAINVANKIQKAYVTAFNWIVTQAQKVSFKLPDWLPENLAGKEFKLAGSVDLKEYNPVDPIGGIDDAFKGILIDSIDAPERPDRYVVDKMPYLNLSDQYNKGYDVGSNLFGKLKDIFTMDDQFNMDDFMENLMGNESLLEDINNNLEDIGGAMPDADGLGGALDDINNNTGGIKGDTGGIKGDTGSINNTLSKEDLQYLTDIGTRKAIERHSSQKVEVTITNQNYISNDMDIDGVVNKINQGLEEYINIGRDGVVSV